MGDFYAVRSNTSAYVQTRDGYCAVTLSKGIILKMQYTTASICNKKYIAAEVTDIFGEIVNAPQVIYVSPVSVRKNTVDVSALVMKYVQEKENIRKAYRNRKTGENRISFAAVVSLIVAVISLGAMNAGSGIVVPAILLTASCGVISVFSLLLCKVPNPECQVASKEELVNAKYEQAVYRMIS